MASEVKSVQTIYNELVNEIALKSGSSWSSLKDSMVGKELLYALSNTLYDAGLLAADVNAVVDLSRLSAGQLLSYAYTHEVPCDTGKPAVVKIGFNNLGGSNKLFIAPFQLKLTIGSSSFYNIDYCDSTQEIFLYQGVVEDAYTSPIAIPMGRWVLDEDAGSKNWQLYLELVKGQFQSSYVKLGRDVLSDSVWVFAQNVAGGGNPVFPYTTYDAALSNPSAKLYKVRTLWDGYMCVLFGDSNWAQLVQPTLYDYRMVWLRNTFNNFTIANSAKVAYYAADGSTSTDYKLQDKGDSSASFYVLSSSNGAQNSEAYMRNYILTKVYAQQGLVTQPQITNFVNSFDSVNSCIVSVGNNLCSIYIKPNTMGDTSFGFLTDYLQQYGGNGGIYYDVRVAEAISYIIGLRDMSAAPSASQVVRAQQLLGEHYSYANTTLATQVSATLVQQYLLLNGIDTVAASVKVRQPFDSVGDDFTLVSLPEANTIRQYDNVGALIGYDANGRFKQYVAYNDQTGVVPDMKITVLGNIFVLFGTDNSVNAPYFGVVNDGRFMVSNTEVAFGSANGRFVRRAGDVWALSDGSRVWVYGDSAFFYQQTDNNIFEAPIYIVPVVGGAQIVDVNGFTVDRVIGVTADGGMIYVYGVYEQAGAIYRYQLTTNTTTNAPEYVHGDDLQILLTDSVDYEDMNASAFASVDGYWVLPTGVAVSGNTGYKLIDSASGTVNIGSYVRHEGEDIFLGDSISTYYYELNGVKRVTCLIADDRENPTVTSLYDGVYNLVATATVNTLTYRMDKVKDFALGAGQCPMTIERYDAEVGFLLTGDSSQAQSPFWCGKTISDIEVAYGIHGNVYEASVVGNVNYNRGVLTGVASHTVGSYLTYNVKGVLTGGETYPQLNYVTIETE